MEQFGLHSKRVLIDNEIVEATVLVKGDKIDYIEKGALSAYPFPIIDHGRYVIMPGIIDSHVHINEPGRTDWEGFDTATRAAAAGGITTLVDMPLNSTPVTTDVKSFQEKMEAARMHCHVNCGFWGGLIPSSHDQLEALLEAGVLGIKVFFVHSGIDDFPNVAKADIIKSAQLLRKHNTLLLAHCELETDHDGAGALTKHPESYIAYLRSRPREWEDQAIGMMIDLCEQHQIRSHIVHLSSSNSISQLQDAKDRGLPISVETCPHYLFFHAEEIPDRSTLHKCAPPIRERENNEQLWGALASGLIDFVVTDHSPSPPALKCMETGSFQKAWGGISGLQMSLQVMWTLAKSKGMKIEKLASIMSENVAGFLNLQDSKGHLRAGYDADIVVWNPDAYLTMDEESVWHKHKMTPYLNHRLYGDVKQTYVNGQLVFDDGKFKQLHQGRLLLKK